MSQSYTIAFYNLENLFDPHDNEATLDKDYTPDGFFKWDRQKYRQKIEHLSRVMAKIGHMRSETAPVLIGVCEVENETCMQDLVQSERLKPYEYGYVFHRSADARGIHVALLYQQKYFEVKNQKGYPIDLGEQPEEEFTRDILHVEGLLFGKKIHLLINHWPSRTEGTLKTNFKRKCAANQVQEILNDIAAREANPNLIVMGDFNDDPLSNTIQDLVSGQLINPMEVFQEQKKGSVKYKGKWMMFDQIMFNRNLQNSQWWHFQEAHIYVDRYLIQKSGRHKGSPKRTYLGSYHQGGYSDHFPVFIYFGLKENV